MAKLVSVLEEAEAARVMEGQVAELVSVFGV